MYNYRAQRSNEYNNKTKKNTTDLAHQRCIYITLSAMNQLIGYVPNSYAATTDQAPIEDRTVTMHGNTTHCPVLPATATAGPSTIPPPGSNNDFGPLIHSTFFRRLCGLKLDREYEFKNEQQLQQRRDPTTLLSPIPTNLLAVQYLIPAPHKSCRTSPLRLVVLAAKPCDAVLLMSPCTPRLEPSSLVAVSTSSIPMSVLRAAIQKATCSMLVSVADGVAPRAIVDEGTMAVSAVAELVHEVILCAASATTDAEAETVHGPGIKDMEKALKQTNKEATDTSPSSPVTDSDGSSRSTSPSYATKTCSPSTSATRINMPVFPAIVTAADSVTLMVNSIWAARNDRSVCLSKVDDLRFYIITHVESSVRAIDLTLITLLWRLTLLRSHDLSYVITFIKVTVELLYLDTYGSGGRILSLMMVPYFELGGWHEFNQWIDEAITTRDEEAICTMTKLYIYLSRVREVRLQKLPPIVLEFLKKRTDIVMKALPIFVSNSRVTRLLVYHLSLMLGVHSECRWMFRQKEGLNVIMPVMLAHSHNHAIVVHCCHILNCVVEGILKRKIRIFKRREATYGAIIRALCFFIRCKDLVASICNFMRKVLELAPDDIEFLSAVDARSAIVAVQKHYYEEDAGIANTSQQVVLMFDEVLRTYKPKRARSKPTKPVRKSKDFRSGATLKKGKSER